MALQGERDAARGAREERDAEQVFEAADALADGAGRQREVAGCSLEAGEARDLAEALQVFGRGQGLHRVATLNDLVQIISFVCLVSRRHSLDMSKTTSRRAFLIDGAKAASLLALVNASRIEPGGFVGAWFLVLFVPWALVFSVHGLAIRGLLRRQRG